MYECIWVCVRMYVCVFVYMWAWVCLYIRCFWSRKEIASYSMSHWEISMFCLRRRCQGQDSGDSEACTWMNRPDHGMLGPFIKGLNSISHGLCEALELLPMEYGLTKPMSFSRSSSVLCSYLGKQWPDKLQWPTFMVLLSLFQDSVKYIFFELCFAWKICINFEWNWICFRAQAACLPSEAKWRWISVRCSHYNLSPPVVFIRNC